VRWPWKNTFGYFIKVGHFSVRHCKMIFSVSILSLWIFWMDFVPFLRRNNMVYFKQTLYCFKVCSNDFIVLYWVTSSLPHARRLNLSMDRSNIRAVASAGASGAGPPHLKSVTPISRLAPRLWHTSNTVF